VRTGSNWRYVGHAGTGFDEEMLRSLTARCSGYPVLRSRFLYSVPRLHEWGVASLTEPQPLKAREQQPDRRFATRRAVCSKPVISTIFLPQLFVHWIVAGLDGGRFHWSDSVPHWLQALALIAVAGGYAL
jgi:hypothetical protein